MNNEKKTIAKNTLFLYSRSFITLFIGLYISRALLHILGVEDFGLYGVVGGIIALLSFINLAMSSASSRYLTVALARSDLYTQRKVYSATFYVHFVIALFTLVVGETIGLWYLCEKLVVPEGRMTAAHWVYQMSILVTIINITQVPYNAAITAHEKMGFSSIWSVVCEILRLLAVLLLSIIDSDKLITYSIFIFIVNLTGAIGFRIYCVKHFEECHLISVKDNHLIKELLSFASFSAFNSFSLVVRNYGYVLLINKFFGVIMNASGNIASMVSGHIVGFTQNVVNAFRPQIVKSYAKNDIIGMQNNINNCSKFCIALYSMLAVPAFIEVFYLLQLWLAEVPTYSDIFCRINLVGCLFSLINMILVIGIQATSKVKTNSIQICLLSIVSILINLVFLLLGANVFNIFIIVSLTEFSIMCTSLGNLKKLIPDFNIKNFIYLLLKVLTIVIISGFIVYSLSFVFSMSILRLILTTITYEILFSLLFYFFMLDTQTQNMVKRIVRQKIKFF